MIPWQPCDTPSWPDAGAHSRSRKKFMIVHVSIQSLAELRYAPFSIGLDSLYPSPTFVNTNRQILPQVLEQNWQIFFTSCADGFVSRPVRQGLAYWSVGISSSLLFPLWFKPPEHTMRFRLECLLYALYVKEESPLMVNPWYTRFFTSATPEEIRRAVRRFARFRCIDFDTETTALQLWCVFCWIIAGRGKTGTSAKGDIFGLLYRAIAWHRKVAAQKKCCFRG